MIRNDQPRAAARERASLTARITDEKANQSVTNDVYRVTVTPLVTRPISVTDSVTSVTNSVTVTHVKIYKKKTESEKRKSPCTP